jgi:hypothetical protein
MISHTEELHDLYRLPSVFRVVESRTLCWAGRMVKVTEAGNAYSILVGK